MEREFLGPLAECGLPAGLPLTAGEVRTGSNGIHLRIGAPGDDDLEIAFEEQSGRLVAGVLHPGWTGRISANSLAAVRNSLIGLYKRAGVALVREQLSRALGSKRAAYDIAGRDLVVWPDPAFARTIRYDLTRRPALHARPLPGIELPMVLAARDAVFAASPVRWADWVSAWEAVGPGRKCPPRLLPDVPILEEAGA